MVGFISILSVNAAIIQVCRGQIGWFHHSLGQLPSFGSDFIDREYEFFSLIKIYILCAILFTIFCFDINQEKSILCRIEIFCNKLAMWIFRYVCVGW